MDSVIAFSNLAALHKLDNYSYIAYKVKNEARTNETLEKIEDVIPMGEYIIAYRASDDVTRSIRYEELSKVHKIIRQMRR